MNHKPLKLPYSFDTFEPYLKADQLEAHYTQHYLKYVETVNELVVQIKPEATELVPLILELEGEKKDPLRVKLYRNACQVFNHELYWNSLADDYHDYIEQYDDLYRAVVSSYGGTKGFIEALHDLVSASFGSNWCTLSYLPKQGKVKWELFHDEGTPLTDLGNQPYRQPLLTIDLWEHARYLQFQSDTAAYLKVMVVLMNWRQADQTIHGLLDPSGTE